MSAPGGTLVPTRKDDTLKIESWPQTVVISVGVATTGAVVVLLANAGWHAESIAGMAALAVGLFTGQAVAARKTATVDAKTDQQTTTLGVIARQTNGASTAQLQEVAERAARAAVEAYRAGPIAPVMWKDEQQ